MTSLKNNAMPWSSISHRSKVIGMVGLTLTAMALQINPNYADFLRKLYEMQEHLPLTIQISVQKHPQGKTRAMAYDLLQVTRTMNRLYRKSPNVFIDLLRQAFFGIWRNRRGINFPHSRFEPLQGDRLITALQASPICREHQIPFSPRPRRNGNGWWSRVVYFCWIWLPSWSWCPPYRDP